MTMKRRVFIKGSLAVSTIGVAVSAGLLTPGAVLAAWPKAALEAKSMDTALQAIGVADAQINKNIKIKAPDVAEDGRVVPITVSSELSDVTNIAIFAKENNLPLSSTYSLGKSAEPYLSTRIKMGKTSDVIAVVTAGGKVYQNSVTIKVTLGGCGG
jgi:sulfur-oxidizing protein SoxY